MYGDDIPAGSYIDDERRIMREDGTPDEFKRTVDDKGYIVLYDGQFDDYAYVDAQGVVHDGKGVATNVKLGIPSNWSVRLQHTSDTPNVPWEEAPVALDEAGDAVYRRSAQERAQGLSDTEGRDTSPEALAAFQAGIVKTKADDAEGHDLRWAGSWEAAHPDLQTADKMHGRPLNQAFVGEDTETTAFRAGTVRAGMAEGDQWTTEYGTSSGQTLHETVQPTSVSGSAGQALLLDPEGAPLNGEFGYVVDPKDGTLFTFKEGEMWAWTGSGWIDISKKTDLLLAAKNEGRDIKAVHHSSALSGAPTAGAGHLWVTNGKITKINNESGHYTPDAEYVWQTIEWLAQQGMAVEDIDIEVVAREKGNAKEILEAWKFRAGRGNVDQIKLKDAVVDELGAPARAEAAEEERLAAEAKERAYASLPADSPVRKHYDRTGCTELDVRRYSPEMGGYLYCEHDQETELDESYADLVGKGVQTVG